MKVGWIGLGLMGRPMVQRLMDSGHDLKVTTRSRERAVPVLEAGAVWANRVCDVAYDRELVVTMLPYPQDVADVYEADGGLLECATSGTVLIDMSTSSPQLARRISERGADRGLVVLDAPVTGGTKGAHAGSLSIMVGGNHDGFESVRPVLESLGSTIVYHGDPGSGQIAKLINQVLVAGVMSGIAEAYTLMRVLGLNSELLLESVGSGSAASSQLQTMWPKLTKGDRSPSFRVAHFHKDLTLAIEMAAEAGITLPVTSAVEQLFGGLVDRGLGDNGTQALADAIPVDIKKIRRLSP